MRVSCPSCKTVYNVADEKIPAKGANLKCAKCKSSFPVRKAPAAEAGDSRQVVPLPGALAYGSVPLPGPDPDSMRTSPASVLGSMAYGRPAPGEAPAPGAGAEAMPTMPGYGPLPSLAFPALGEGAVPLPGLDGDSMPTVQARTAVPLPGVEAMATAPSYGPNPGPMSQEVGEEAVPLPGFDGGAMPTVQGAAPVPLPGADAFEPFSGFVNEAMPTVQGAAPVPLPGEETVPLPGIDEGAMPTLQGAAPVPLPGGRQAVSLPGVDGGAMPTVQGAAVVPLPGGGGADAFSAPQTNPFMAAAHETDDDFVDFRDGSEPAPASPPAPAGLDGALDPEEFHSSPFEEPRTVVRPPRMADLVASQPAEAFTGGRWVPPPAAVPAAVPQFPAEEAAPSPFEAAQAAPAGATEVSDDDFDLIDASSPSAPRAAPAYPFEEPPAPYPEVAPAAPSSTEDVDLDFLEDSSDKSRAPVSPAASTQQVVPLFAAAPAARSDTASDFLDLDAPPPARAAPRLHPVAPEPAAPVVKGPDAVTDFLNMDDLLPKPAPAAQPPAPRAELPSGTDLDFLNLGGDTSPAASSAGASADPFDLMGEPPSSAAPLGGEPAWASSPQPPPVLGGARGAKDLELLDFGDGGAQKGGDAGAARYHVRRKSGKVFGPFDVETIVKMLREGQLLGNEEVSTDGDSWVSVGTVPAFANAIQALMEGPADAGPAETQASSKEDSTAKALERIKALYGDRMAAITIVDGGATERKVRKYVPFAAGALVVALVLGVGTYLGSTPYGYFGTRRLFPKTLKEGSTAWSRFKDASKALGEDTFDGYRRSVAEAERLLAENESAVESRALFVQGVAYLKRRYAMGEDKFPRAKRFLAELELGTRDKPEVVKARMGIALIEGGATSLRGQLEALARSRPDDLEPLYLIAESYLVEKNAAGATQAFKKLLDADGKSAKAMHGLGLALELEKAPDHAAAIAQFEKALATDPKHLSSAVEAAAVALFKLAQPEKAEAFLAGPLSEAGAKALAPLEQARANHAMAVILAGRNDIVEAEKRFESSLKLHAAADARADFGWFLLKRRNFARASELFEAARAVDPKNIDHLDGLVRGLIGNSKLASADQALQQAAKDHPGNPRIAFLQARLAHEAGKLADAEQNYKRAITGDPKYWEPRVHLGRLYLRQNKHDDAKKAIDEAIVLAPGAPDTHAAMGQYLMALGKTQDARAEFAKAAELDPHFGPAHFGMGQVLFAEGKLEEARRELEEAVAADGSQPRLYDELGALLWKMKDLPAAVVAFEKAKNADPKDAEAQWKLGAVYFDMGKLSDASSNLEASLVLDPSIPDTYYTKARVHRARHENTQAIEAMKSALERSSARPEFRYEFGNILLQANRFGEAVDEWSQAVKLRPDYADALEALGRAYQERQDYASAIGFLETALRIDPARSRLLMNVGDCLFNRNQFDKAIAKFQEALALDDTQHAAYFRIGRAYNEKGRLNEAVEWYQRSAKKDPDAKEVWRWLGYAYKEKGRKAEAIDAFERYLKVLPDAGDAKDIGNEIYDLKSQ